jgi:hypothetical protein
LLACDYEVVAFVAGKRIAECLPLAELLLDGVTHDSVQIVLAICVGVRITICEVDCIVGILEGVFESMCKERALGATFI